MVKYLLGDCMFVVGTEEDVLLQMINSDPPTATSLGVGPTGNSNRLPKYLSVFFHGYVI